MKTKFLLIIAIIIAASASIEVNEAYASCIANVDYNLKLKESELVFTGTVTRLDNYDGPQKVTFFIHDIIKGEINTPKYILENLGKIFLEDGSVRGSSVSMDYKIGKTYKVYVENGMTSQCTTKTITPPAGYMWEPGPEDGKYYSANPVPHPEPESPYTSNTLDEMCKNGQAICDYPSKYGRPFETSIGKSSDGMILPIIVIGISAAFIFGMIYWWKRK